MPIYLLHRFQIEAVGKLIGGYEFSYAHRGDGQSTQTAVAADRQRRAVGALVSTLDPRVLKLSDEIVAAIPPRPPGYAKSRETFSAATGSVFDPVAPAHSAVALTLRVLLEPSRAARLNLPDSIGFTAVSDALLAASWHASRGDGISAAIQRQTNMQVLHGLLGLAFDADASDDVRAQALSAVTELDDWLSKQSPREPEWNSHYRLAQYELERILQDPTLIERSVPVTVPPGSPIGSN